MLIKRTYRRRIQLTLPLTPERKHAKLRAELYSSVRFAILAAPARPVPALNRQKEIAGLPVARLLLATLRLRLHNAKA